MTIGCDIVFVYLSVYSCLLARVPGYLTQTGLVILTSLAVGAPIQFDDCVV